MSANRILIVDDQTEIRRLLRATLELSGRRYQVVDVPSAEEALLEFMRQPVDLLVVDLRLPGISGLELVERLRRRKADVKVLLITGQSDGKTRERIEKSNIDGFLIKPIEISEFVAVVEQLLGLAPPPAKETPPATAPIPEKSAPPVQSTPVATAAPSKSAPPVQPAPTVTPAPQKDAPPVVAPAPPTTVEPMSISDRIILLRQQLNALTVMLLNETGQTVAQAGHLSELDPGSAISTALMASLSATSKVSGHLNRKEPETFLYIGGSEYNLLAIPLRAGFSILIAAEHETPQSFAPHIDQFIRPAIKDLLDNLDEMGLLIEEHPEELLEISATDMDLLADLAEPDEELEALFAQASPQKIVPVDVDSFWEALTDQAENNRINTADVLSYEEALRLGLAPDDIKS